MRNIQTFRSYTALTLPLALIISNHQSCFVLCIHIFELEEDTTIINTLSGLLGRDYAAEAMLLGCALHLPLTVPIGPCSEPTATGGAYGLIE